MEWSAWSDARAGIDAEVAEPLVRELFLSRKVALVKTNESFSGLYASTSLLCISRTRRVMQTLGAIMMSSDLDNYYQAVYLLEFLHDLYPDIISVHQYSQLLVYIKSQVCGIYVACCSTLNDRMQAAHYLIRQLFDSYSYESGDRKDKMVLHKAHKLGSAELKKVLSNGKKLSLVRLSAQPLTRELYNKMCEILQEFLGGIDRKLPLPTVVQLIEKNYNSEASSTEVEDATPYSLKEEQCSSHSKLVIKRYRTRRKRNIVPPDRFSYTATIIKDKGLTTDSDSADSIVPESVTSSVIPNITLLSSLK